MKTLRKHRLTGMEYDEVSLVDNGANQDAHVVLFKRDTQAGSTNSGRKPLSSGEDRPNRKESRPMTTSVVEKTKAGRVCADCGTDMGPGESACSDCGSTDVKKSIIIVRKEISDENEELDPDVQGVLDEIKDDEEEDGEKGEEDEDDGEVEVTAKSFTPEQTATVSVEALSIATDLASKITKVFESGVSKTSPAEYEEAMVDFNTSMDKAVEGWLAKTFVADSEISKKAGVVRTQITEIIKNATEGGVMPQHTRPSALDALDLPADVAEYISGLEENAGVQKNDDIYKGLSPEVTEIVKNAERIIEEQESEKWLGVAKSFDAVPGDKVELAKSLRTLHDSDPDAYENLRKSLVAANTAAKSGGITKQFGQSGGGEPTSVIEKRKTEAQELVTKGQFATVEQAEVHLMSTNPSEYVEN